MSDSGKVEIRITGAVDSSLAASAAQANATIGTVGSQTTITAKAMSDALKATGGDLSKITPEMLSVGSAAATAGNTAASGLKVAEEATKGLNFATSGAIQEYIRLGHEALTGNYSRMPGSMIVLTSRAGGFREALAGLNAGMVTASGGAALLLAVLGYLAYQEIENQREITKLADGFALTGRASLMSATAVETQIGFLSRLPGVNRAAATSFLEYVSAHASIDPILANETGQLLPRFIELFGKQGPQAVGKLTETLSNLTVEGFQKLNHEMLGLAPAEYELIENLISTGHEAEAVNRIMADLSRQTGIYIKSLGDEVYDDLQKISALHKIMETGQAALIDGRMVNVGDVQAKLRQVKQDLDNLRGDEAKANQVSADNKFNTTYDEEKKRSLSEQGRLTQQLAKDQQQLNDAEKRGNVPSAVNAAKAAIADDNKKIAEAEKHATDQSYRDFQTAEEAKAELYKAGSAKRIAIDEEVLAKAKALYGADSVEYNRALAKRNSDERSAGEQGARAGAKAAKEAKDEVIRSLEEEANAARQGSQERIDADQKWLDYAKKAFGERSQQAHTANDALIRDERALVDQQIRDAQAVAEEQIRAANDAASTQMRALEQVAKYSSMTAEEETAQAREIERTRDAAVKESLNVARKAAGDNENAIRSVNKQIEDEATTHQKRLDDITRQGLDLQVQEWSRFNQRVTSAEDELVGDIFSANQSLWTSLRQVGLHFLQQMVADDIKYWTERELLAAEGVKAENAAEHGGITDFIRLLTQKTTAATAAQAAQTTTTVTGQATQTSATATGTAAREAIGATENTTFLGRIFSQIGQWLGLETAKTADTTAGTAARVTANTTEAAATIAASKAQAVAEIPAYTGIAAMEAASAVAGIPIVGPALAAAAVAEMDALGAGQLSLASAAGGMERVGFDGQIIEAHRDESVLPARIAVPFMTFAGALPSIAQHLANSNVGPLLPVMSPSASVRAASSGSSSMSDADYLASKVGGGGVSSRAPAPSGSTGRGGDIHIHAWDASSMNQFFRKPSNRRTMDKISKDRVRAGFLPA